MSDHIQILTAEEQIIDDTRVGFFTDTKGRLSMRRLLSFILCLTSIVVSVLCIYKTTTWQVILIASGIPLLGSLLFMFFTSWESVAKVARAVKSGT